jgi:hypothetical protein
VTEIGVRANASACELDGTSCSNDSCHSGESCLDGICQDGTPALCGAGEHCEAARGCVSEAPGLGCPGDCDHGGDTSVDELMTGVMIALDRLPLAACAVFDRDFNARLSVDELVGAVHAALTNCGG